MAARRRRRRRRSTPTCASRKASTSATRAHFDALLHGCIARGRRRSTRVLAAPRRPQDHRAVADRARRADDRRLRAEALHRRSRTRWRSTKRSSSPRASAAPTATSTSTACSTRPPPTCARSRWPRRGRRGADGRCARDDPGPGTRVPAGAPRLLGRHRRRRHRLLRQLPEVLRARAHRVAAQRSASARSSCATTPARLRRHRHGAALPPPGAPRRPARRHRRACAHVGRASLQHRAAGAGAATSCWPKARSASAASTLGTFRPRRIPNDILLAAAHRMNQDLSIVTLVLHASFVVQVVMAGLMLASLASWTVIFGKLFGLRRVRSAATTTSSASSGPARTSTTCTHDADASAPTRADGAHLRLRHARVPQAARDARRRRRRAARRRAPRDARELPARARRDRVATCRFLALGRLGLARTSACSAPCGGSCMRSSACRTCSR